MTEPNTWVTTFLRSTREMLIEQSWKRLRICVESLTDEQIWWRPNPSSNSIGNLVLHLNGNITQWIINSFTHANDHRDRPAEFSHTEGISRNDLVQTLAATMVDGAALRALSSGDTENNYTYRHLEDVLRRMTTMPGERVMVLVSPGFILANSYLDESGIIDRANRANVVIHTLDARGLYTPDVMGDISQPSSDSFRTGGYKTMYRVDAQFENEFVLSDFAYGTGGMFFHNSNDLKQGLELEGLAPDISYVLAFSPQNSKMDGRYHQIAVKLAKKTNYTVQARHGYYAPHKVDDPQELAKQEIQDAIFSQEEISDLPLDLQTQYFKGESADARLSVVSRVDLKNVHFKKTDGRSWDDLTLATAIFDENGNFVTGGEKTVKMRLLEPTYERLSRTGLTVKSSFAVKPGRYLVRQVVRDSEGSQMAARNGAVEIPF